MDECKTLATGSNQKDDGKGTRHALLGGPMVSGAGRPYATRVVTAWR